MGKSKTRPQLLVWYLLPGSDVSRQEVGGVSDRRNHRMAMMGSQICIEPVWEAGAILVKPKG